MVSGLEGRRSALEALSKHWEEFESKWSSTETKLNAIEERGKLVDTVVRSKQHLLDIIKTLNVSYHSIHYLTLFLIYNFLFFIIINNYLGRNAHQPFVIRSPNCKGLANRLTNVW